MNSKEYNEKREGLALKQAHSEGELEKMLFSIQIEELDYRYSLLKKLSTNKIGKAKIPPNLFGSKPYTHEELSQE